jgi:hypothetical protein
VEWVHLSLWEVIGVMLEAMGGVVVVCMAGGREGG